MKGPVRVCAVLCLAALKCVMAGNACPSLPSPVFNVPEALRPFVSVNMDANEATNQTVVLNNVTTVDPADGSIRKGVAVLLQGPYIAEIGAAGTLKGDTVIDYSGREVTVLPALVGMHEHLFYPLPASSFLGYSMDVVSFPALYLAAGITVARTAGSMHPYADLATASNVNNNLAPGPRILATAPYVNGAPIGLSQFANLTTKQQVTDHVSFWQGQGFDNLKLYLNLPPDHASAAIVRAHSLGQKVTGHICMTSLGEAAALGIDCLEHGPIVSSDFFPPGADRQELCLAGRAAESAMAGLDIETDERVSDLIETLIGHNVTLSSTLSVFEATLPNSPPLSLQEATVKPYLPPLAWEKYVQGYKARSQPSPASINATKALANEAKFEALFLRRGGRLVFGADPTGVGGVVAGFSDLRNLELLVSLGGLTPMEALRVASYNGATYLDAQDCVGSLAVGSYADLVVVEGDPLTSISAMRDVQTVFRDGIGYDIDTLKQLATANLVTWA